MSENELPMIVSVDDHVVEPADLWQRWLPAKYRDRGPRVERRGIDNGHVPSVLPLDPGLEPLENRLFLPKPPGFYLFQPSSRPNHPCRRLDSA